MQDVWWVHLHSLTTPNHTFYIIGTEIGECEYLGAIPFETLGSDVSISVNQGQCLKICHVRQIPLTIAYTVEIQWNFR